jgi:acetyltransferase-like isoleucine patch superfamily enzyme
MGNILIEKNEPLTTGEKKLFGYFGEGAKIRPPFRILNPQNIFIGDKTSIRENAFIHAYKDLSELLNYVKPEFKNYYTKENYLYNGRIEIGREVQIGRFLLMSSTYLIRLEDHVLLSERVFVGDNNHTFSHPFIPIIQQPNKVGNPIHLGKGTWIGVGSAILSGTKLGVNSIVGANSIVEGEFPSHAVIGSEKAKLLFRRFDEKSLKEFVEKS